MRTTSTETTTSGDALLEDTAACLDRLGVALSASQADMAALRRHFMPAIDAQSSDSPSKSVGTLPHPWGLVITASVALNALLLVGLSWSILT